MIRDIGEGVLKRATAANANGRDFNALLYLSALSDYPDSVFDYKQNEQSINKMIRDAYRNLNVR